MEYKIDYSAEGKPLRVAEFAPGGDVTFYDPDHADFQEILMKSGLAFVPNDQVRDANLAREKKMADAARDLQPPLSNDELKRLRAQWALEDEKKEG